MKSSAFILLLIGSASEALLASSSLDCDVLIAGGSLSSLSAAITASESFPKLHICLTEPTDWPGGQFTSSGVSAPDFGLLNRYSENLPSSFNDLIAAASSPVLNYKCWVSTVCLMPDVVFSSYVQPTLKALPNLTLLQRTVVKQVSVAPDNAVSSVTVVTRSPVEASAEWGRLFSEEAADWYSPSPSQYYGKEVTEISARVFVDATEFGDVLALLAPVAGITVTTGVEKPSEDSLSADSNCGQSTTVVYFMDVLAEDAAGAWVPPLGDSYGGEWNLVQDDWNRTWSYRRAECGSGCGGSYHDVHVGDKSQINFGNGGNDFTIDYMFLPDAALDVSDWSGGLNTTALGMAEQRAYASFHFLVGEAPDAIRPLLAADRDATGTLHGLSKLPYVRDTRRSFGIGGFRLSYDDLVSVDGTNLGQHFEDTVALTNYPADIHPLEGCSYPADVNPTTTCPSYLPLRALTVDKVPNLLVAGKTMSQTFHANAATRLHPSEWSSGLSAGFIAGYIVEKGWTEGTYDALQNVEDVRNQLKKRAGQVLEWTGEPQCK